MFNTKKLIGIKANITNLAICKILNLVNNINLNRGNT